MKKEELIVYIEKELKKGFNPIRIKKKLFDSGYNLIKIEEAFEVVEKKRRRKHEIIYGGLALVVIIIGFALFINYTPEQINSGASFTDTEVVEITDSQLLADAVRNDNPASCEEIADEELKEKCLIAANMERVEYTEEEITDRDLLASALKEKNQELCAGISDNILKEKCISLTEE